MGNGLMMPASASEATMSGCTSKSAKLSSAGTGVLVGVSVMEFSRSGAAASVARAVGRSEVFSGGADVDPRQIRADRAPFDPFTVPGQGAAPQSPGRTGGRGGCSRGARTTAGGKGAGDGPTRL
ncbi:hypothetical protein GCM10027517_22600 [Phycicoccus ginsengisoli]